MTIVALCLIPLALLLAPWGFGSMMAAIAKIRGWDAKRVFWVSAIVYALLPIVIYLIAWFAGVMLYLYSLGDALLILIYLIVGFGVLIAPTINLAIRARNPDLFKKTTVSHTSPPSNVPLVVKPEPAFQNPAPLKAETVVPSKLEPVSAPAARPKVEAGSSHIFVSYRRSDSADIAGRIYDRLIGKFGKGPIFKDVDSIPLGLDFKEYLDMKVGECDVFLAIIGDEWVNASDSKGNHRLDDPTDFVRIEIESALERKIPVIPLLVRDAHMPREDDLPSSLRKLVYRNGTPIRSDPDFHRDMDRLIAALEKYVERGQ
jgi:hypothetical protein